MSEIEAQELQAALEWTLSQIEGNVTQFRREHNDAETVLGIKADFVALAYVRCYQDGTTIIGDYVSLGMALLRLLDARKRIAELEDAVAMRDACLKNLGAWEDL